MDEDAARHISREGLATLEAELRELELDAGLFAIDIPPTASFTRLRASFTRLRQALQAHADRDEANMACTHQAE